MNLTHSWQRARIGFTYLMLVLGLTKTAHALTMQDAIQLALQHNVTMRLTIEKQKESNGNEWQALSSLLPQVTATASQFRATQNLASVGQSPELIGPYQSFDARLGVEQTLFDFHAIKTLQAAASEKQKAELAVLLAHENTAAQAGLAYLNAITAEALRQAALSDLHLAKSQLVLVSDRHGVGLETILDQTRAQVLVSRADLAVTRAANQKTLAELNLKRIVGLPTLQTISLDDVLTARAATPLPLDHALAMAQKQRVELQLAKTAVEESAHRVAAAAGKQLPVISALGDYGYSGNTPAQNSDTTYRFGIQMRLPVFDGGHMAGDVQASSSQKRQAELVLHDLQTQIDAEVVNALNTVASANIAVTTAAQIEKLASQEYQQVEDELKSGTGDDVDLITAHGSLQRARQEHIAALAEFNVARLELALALGQMESFK